MLPDGLVIVGLHPLLSQLRQLCTHSQVPHEPHPDALLSCHHAMMARMHGAIWLHLKAWTVARVWSICIARPCGDAAVRVMQPAWHVAAAYTTHAAAAAAAEDCQVAAGTSRVEDVAASTALCRVLHVHWVLSHLCLG
jgi:hypothetical protein